MRGKAQDLAQLGERSYSTTERDYYFQEVLVNFWNREGV